MIGHPGDPDLPAAELDKEQDVQTLEQHGVDVEEVRGHDSRRLGTQELAPGGAAPPGCRAEAVIFHDPGDGARCQVHPELQKFTLDTPIAPPRVLGGQAQSEGGRLVVDGRTTPVGDGDTSSVWPPTGGAKPVRYRRSRRRCPKTNGEAAD